MSSNYSYNTYHNTGSIPSQHHVLTAPLSNWPSGYPAPQGGPVPVAQYSSLANYDGSYTQLRSSQPMQPEHPHSQGGYFQSHHASAHGVPVVPSNGPGGSRPTTMTAASNPVSSKSFLCEICGQSFTRAHDRKRHSQIHTRLPDEGPRCQYCNRKFSREDALKRHLDRGCDDMPDDVYAQRRCAN